jgi:hypothetical protein
MLSAPDIHDLPIDLDELTGRIRDVTATATDQARKASKRARRAAGKGQQRALALTGSKPKRSLPRLTWPLVVVVGGIGLYVTVRSRRSNTSDVGQSQPSGAYARN